jgi:hypothetical protein
MAAATGSVFTNIGENTKILQTKYFYWVDMCKRLGAENTIDQELQHAIFKEGEKWELMSHHLCSVVVLLPKKKN